MDAFRMDDTLAVRVAAASVTSTDGRSGRLRDFWRDGPTVNVFLRQFGCLFCHQMVDEVVRSSAAIAYRGAKIVLIGNGTPEQARGFVKRKLLDRPEITVLSDPARESYQAADFRRSYARTFAHPKAIGAYRRARSGGFRIAGVFGDIAQLGGLMVVRPPARLSYLHRSRFAGDHPDMGAVVAALDAA